MVTVATAVTAAWPAVAQQRSLVASGGEQSSGGEEKGKRLGGSPKMGRGSRAKANWASAHGGRRLSVDGKLRSAVDL
jgi:hypothetical protein